MNKNHRWLLIGLVVLCLNSSYLAGGGDPNPFYFANLVIHLVLGLGLLVPFTVWWWRRRSQPFVLVSGLLLLLSAVLGLALVKTGNLMSTKPLLWSHIAVAVLGLIGLVAALGRWRGARTATLAAGSLVVLILAPILWLRADMKEASSTEQIVNPRATVTMAEEVMGGESGPFFPSSVSTTRC